MYGSNAKFELQCLVRSLVIYCTARGPQNSNSDQLHKGIFGAQEHYIRTERSYYSLPCKCNMIFLTYLGLAAIHLSFHVL